MSKSPKNRLSKILKTVLAVSCIVAASVGATLYYVTSSWSPWAAHSAVEPHNPMPAAPSAPIDVPAPIFLELQPFTAMLHDAQNRRRVLYVAITLHVDNEDARALFTEYMPEVRDRILRKLSMQDPIAVQTPTGRTLLAQELTSTLEAPYHPYLSSPRIQNVLFTAFMVQ